MKPDFSTITEMIDNIYMPSVRDSFPINQVPSSVLDALVNVSLFAQKIDEAVIILWAEVATARAEMESPRQPEQEKDEDEDRPASRFWDP